MIVSANPMHFSVFMVKYFTAVFKMISHSLFLLLWLLRYYSCLVFSVSLTAFQILLNHLLFYLRPHLCTIFFSSLSSSCDCNHLPEFKTNPFPQICTSPMQSISWKTASLFWHSLFSPIQYFTDVLCLMFLKWNHLFIVYIFYYLLLNAYLETYAVRLISFPFSLVNFSMTYYYEFKMSLSSSSFCYIVCHYFNQDNISYMHFYFTQNKILIN